MILALIAGCSDDDTDPPPNDPIVPETPTTGTATFNIEIYTTDDNTPDDNTPDDNTPIDCASAGVTTVTCNIYDEANTLIGSGGPWPCDQRSFRVENIAPGANQTFTILGKNADDGDIVYRGITPEAVTITAGEESALGDIDLSEFVPRGFGANPVSGTRIDLSWTDQGAAGYRIYRNGEEIAASDQTTHTDDGLSAGTEYCYTICAHDAFNNLSGHSTQVCATPTEPADGEAPTVPTEISATAQTAGQIDVTWTAATDNVGVTGYTIYRNGDEAGTIAAPPFSDTGLTADTQYCYQVSAQDAAGNTSAQSEGDHCATTPLTTTWYNDGDEDGYGDSDTSMEAQEQPEGYVSDNTDCDDGDDTVHPGIEEEPYNGKNDDCNDETPDDDIDKDGFLNAEDCDDKDPEVNPRAEEIVDNGKDDDCNEETPDSSLDIDDDGDGFTENQGDCRDDDQPRIHPDAMEVCNEIDDNCNETVDEECKQLINVDIDKDFTYTESDFLPMGLRQGGNGYVYPFKDNPYENLFPSPQHYLPTHYINQEYEVKYSYMRLGNAADRMITFAIIRLPNPYTGDKYEYFVDTNNDEKFDKAEFFQAQHVTYTAMVTFELDILTDSGETLKRPYRIELRRFSDTQVWFTPKCYHIAEALAIGDETFTAVAAETNAYDALYKTNGLFIDLNNSGEFEFDGDQTEQIYDDDVITLKGVDYVIRLNYQ